MITLIRTLLKKELVKFAVAGATAVGADMSVYYLLIDNMNKNIAKGVSFLAGTIIAYSINKFWTFEKHEKSYSEIIKFIILYLTSLILNVSVNKLVLQFNVDYIFGAFILATICSAAFNFTGQKFWVFKK